MSAQIVASVGASGRNRRSDVQTVQRLLTDRGMPPGSIDGLCGPRTIRAIITFQGGFLLRPDGRVDPHGITWRHLAGVAGPSGPPQPKSPSVAPITPVPSTASPSQVLLLKVPRPSPSSINQGLTAVSPEFMIQQLGRPRETFSADCQPMTNPTLLRHLMTGPAGNFTVTGLRPAVESLRRALAQVHVEQPAVHAILGTAGMLEA